jgi:hypothetical protein
MNDTQKIILSQDEFCVLITALRISHAALHTAFAMLRRHGLIDADTDFNGAIESNLSMLRAAEAAFAARS